MTNTSDSLRDELVQRLDALIAEMSRPLPLGQRIRGAIDDPNVQWTEAKRKRWLAELRKHRADLAADRRPTIERPGWQFSLEQDDVIDGAWYGEIGRVEALLHRLIQRP